MSTDLDRVRQAAFDRALELKGKSDCESDYKLLKNFSALLNENQSGTAKLLELFYSIKGPEILYKYFIARCLFTLGLIDESEAEEIKNEFYFKHVEGIIEFQKGNFGEDPQDYIQERAKLALDLMRKKPLQKDKLIQISEDAWSKKLSWGHHIAHLSAVTKGFVEPVQKI